MEIINHKGKYYLKTETGYREVLATTDTSLKIEIDGNRGDLLPDVSFDINLPQPSQQFIEKYIEEYNKGNVITDVLVEYENKFDGKEYVDELDAYGYDIIKSILKINPKDNSLNICFKDNYTREEVDRMLDEQASKTTAEMLEKFKDYKSREEVIELIADAMSSCTNGTSSHCQDFDKWIEENL